MSDRPRTESRVRALIQVLRTGGGTGRPSVVRVRGEFFDPQGNNSRFRKQFRGGDRRVRSKGLAGFLGAGARRPYYNRRCRTGRTENLMALMAFMQAAEEAGPACENDGLDSSPDRSSGRR